MSRGRPEKEQRRARGGLRTAALLSVLALALTADSNLRLVTTEYELTVPNLPAAFDGLRIVQLSDLHGACFGRENERLAAAVAAAAPDLIVLTGDFIDTAQDLPTVHTLCHTLSALAPVYFVSGNHDWASGAIVRLADVLEQTGVTYLRGAWEVLERGGERLVLCGVEDPNSFAETPGPVEVVARLREEAPDACVLLLAHRNLLAREMPGLDVDAILCGHAHGGVIRLPFVGGLVSTELTVPAEYECGLYETGRYTMLVSRGLGRSGPVPRLLNNPEVVVATLRCGA